jgi:hypothetical protein
MIRRLQKKDGPLDLACHHLEEHLETKVRVRQSKVGAKKSWARPSNLTSESG